MMKITYIGSRALPLMQMLLIAGLLPAIQANAQFVTVKGTIQTDEGVKIADAKILAIDMKSGKPHEVAAKYNGEYVIEHLAPDTIYRFAGCGSPYSPDKSKWKGQKLFAPAMSINFVLHSRSTTHLEYRFPDRKTELNNFLYLMDADTGCLIGQFAKSPKSTKNDPFYEITGWGSGINACTRKSGNNGVYECYPTVE